MPQHIIIEDYKEYQRRKEKEYFLLFKFIFPIIFLALVVSAFYFNMWSIVLIPCIVFLFGSILLWRDELKIIFGRRIYKKQKSERKNTWKFIKILIIILIILFIIIYSIKQEGLFNKESLNGVNGNFPDEIAMKLCNERCQLSAFHNSPERLQCICDNGEILYYNKISGSWIK